MDVETERRYATGLPTRARTCCFAVQLPPTGTGRSSTCPSHSVTASQSAVAACASCASTSLSEVLLSKDTYGSQSGKLPVWSVWLSER